MGMVQFFFILKVVLVYFMIPWDICEHCAVHLISGSQLIIGGCPPAWMGFL